MFDFSLQICNYFVAISNCSFYVLVWILRDLFTKVPIWDIGRSNGAGFSCLYWRAKYKGREGQKETTTELKISRRGEDRWDRRHEHDWRKSEWEGTEKPQGKQSLIPRGLSLSLWLFWDWYLGLRGLEILKSLRRAHAWFPMRDASPCAR